MWLYSIDNGSYERKWFKTIILLLVAQQITNGFALLFYETVYQSLLKMDIYI